MPFVWHPLFLLPVRVLSVFAVWSSMCYPPPAQLRSYARMISVVCALPILLHFSYQGRTYIRCHCGVSLRPLSSHRLMSSSCQREGISQHILLYSYNYFCCPLCPPTVLTVGYLVVYHQIGSWESLFYSKFLLLLGCEILLVLLTSVLVVEFAANAGL